MDRAAAALVGRRLPPGPDLPDPRGPGQLRLGGRRAPHHGPGAEGSPVRDAVPGDRRAQRSEEHTSELQSQSNLVCRLLLEKKKKQKDIGSAARQRRSNSAISVDASSTISN